MSRSDKMKRESLRFFMGALRRDVRANTLAIMAAMLFPLAGLVGGGIDVAQVTLIKEG